jgi:acyl carrier protein
MDTTIEPRTRAYLQENHLYMRPDVHVERDDSLLERGIIDSIGVMELVQFLEQEFAIEIPGEEITEENLGSLAAIARYVGSKRALGMTAA